MPIINFPIVTKTAAPADVGLGNVSNLAPANLPVSTAQAVINAAANAAIALKAPIASPTFTGAVTLAQDGATALQAVTLQQLQAAALSLGKRTRARVATTANITIATALVTGQVLNGIALVDGDLVLVKNQTAAAQNGVYIVGAVPARALEFDTWGEFPGAIIVVYDGTVNPDTIWFCTSNDGGTLGVTAIDFSQFAAAPAQNSLTPASAVFAPTVDAVNAGLATKLTDLAGFTLGAGTTAITHAAHANRYGEVNQAGATTATFAATATSGALARDSIYIRNIGAGTLTATGTITAPAGTKLTAGPGEVLTADYSATLDAWISTTVSATAGADPVTVTGSTVNGSTLTAAIAAGWQNSGGNWTRAGTNISGATALTYATVSADGGTQVTYKSASIPFVPTGIAVAAAGSAPVFSAQSAPGGTVGVAYSYTFVASNTTSFSVFSGALPAGLSLNTSTGAVTGTPTTAATYTYVIRATGAGGTTDSTSQSVVVSAGSANMRYTSPPAEFVESGSGQYTYTLTTTAGFAQSNLANGTLKFPASAAASLTFRITEVAPAIELAVSLVTGNSDTAGSVGFSSWTNSVLSFVHASGTTSGYLGLYSSTGTVVSGQADGSFAKFERDAAGLVTASQSLDGIAWNVRGTAATTAGNALFIKVQGFGSAAAQVGALALISNTGLVAAP